MADAAALIQAVTDMEERARQVPETVKAMVDLAGEYHAEVDAYLERVSQKKDRVAALKSKIDEVLNDLQAKPEGERPVLEGGMKEIETAIEQAREAVDASVNELETALDATAAAVTKLQSELSDAGERAEAAQSAAGGDLDGLRGQMTSSESGLDTFVATAMNTAEGVEGAAGEAKDKVVEGLNALAERMLEYVEQHVATRLDRAADAIETLFEEHSTHVTGVLTALDTGAKELGQQVAAEIDEKVTDRVSALVQQAAESYLMLQGAHEQATESGGNEREETGEAATELFGCIAPMDQMVNQVRQAATNVNLTFPA